MTTQEMETINKLKQQFSDNFLVNSNEVEFTNFLNNLVSKGILKQGTAYNYHATKPKKFFKGYFDIDIFRVQKNGIEFLESCLKEMKDGNLARINRNREKGIDIPKFDGTPSASLEYYIKFLQQKETDSEEIPTTEEDSVQNKGDTMNDKTKILPLNQILYGPPGTGKTYSTIDKALGILRHYKVIDEIPESREDKRAIFDEYRANKQIEFVTFHQSFSYEEFVEGIKPKLIDSSNGAESSEMSYTIKNGIFKEICDRALYKEFQFKSGESEIQANTKTRVWKISIVAKSEDKELRDEILKHCLEKGEIRIGWSDNRTQEQISMLGRNDQSSIYQFENEADIGDIVCVFENANGDIKGIGIIESEFYWDDTDNSEALKLYPRARKVKWLSKEEINIRDLNGGIGLTLKTFYPLYRVEAIELLNRIGKLNEKDLIIDNTQKPFVLIIDEINRGNISKILGELITLIEPSKRIGASDEEKARGIGDESLEVTLPYSNDSFGVPSNLYIIGTMNTADRSIALLDTALRRRFEFVEMMPNVELLGKIEVENGEIDLQKLLTKMNERIEFLLDREHTIGHAFFFEKAIKKDGYFVLSLDSLKEIFAKKIIPLLQEYFYDDYVKIQAVLNDNDMIKPKPKPEFLSKFSDEVNDEKVVYEIEKEWQKWELWQFVKIYNSKATKSQSQDSGESDKNE